MEKMSILTVAFILLMFLVVMQVAGVGWALAIGLISIAAWMLVRLFFGDD